MSLSVINKSIRPWANHLQIKGFKPITPPLRCTGLGSGKMPSAGLSHRLFVDDALLSLDQWLLRHIKSLVSVFRSYCSEIVQRMKRYPSWHIHVCMNQIQKKRIYYPSLNLFVSCNLYKQMLQDAINSVVHKICDVLNFLEIREMIRISSNLANLCSIITFCLSAAHLLNEVLAD